MSDFGPDFGPERSAAFTLAGARFTVDLAVPSAVLVDLVGALGHDARGNRTYDGPGMARFLSAVLGAEYPRLLALCSDKARPVEVAVLGRLIVYLAEQVTGRPTVPPAHWSCGRRRTGVTCGDGCSAPVRRPRATRRPRCATWPTPAG